MCPVCNSRKKKILIAHQSSIPKYREAFYEKLNELMPNNLDFSVVVSQENKKLSSIYNKTGVENNSYTFQTVEVNSLSIKILNKIIGFQFFLPIIKDFDMLVVEDALYNLSYPTAFFWSKITKKKVVLWGQGYDRNFKKNSFIKQFGRLFKKWQSKKCDSYFVYNTLSRKILLKSGVESDKIIKINNTIDIKKNRDLFQKSFDPQNRKKKNLLFIGRLEKDKGIDLLISVAKNLKKIDEEYNINIIGGGPEQDKLLAEKSVNFHGPIYDTEMLLNFYMEASAYIILGSIGLGPVQAICYDLPIIAVEGLRHGPERSYLNNKNSYFLDPSLSSGMMAIKINTFLEDSCRYKKMQLECYNTIKHLTIENMAKNFINGIDVAFGK